MKASAPTLAVVLATCLLAVPGRAEVTTNLDARGSLYRDSDRTTITTAAVAGTFSPVTEIGIRGSYLADIVSSASIDVVSAATDRFDETRHEASVTPSYSDGTTSLSAGYRYSIENDWRSHSAMLDGSRDFFGHDLTLGFGASVVYNDIWRVDDDNFGEEQWVVGLGTTAIVVAGRNDIWSLGYSGSLAKGYQASPYRFVRFTTPIGFVATTPETVPDERWRHAVTATWNHHAFTDTAIRSHGRAYVDSWGILSGTVGSEYVVGFGNFEPALFARLYAQSAASFYQDIYDRRRRYMTADKEMSPLYDVFSGARLTYRHRGLGPLDELRLEAKGTGFAFVMPDFARLPRRHGFVADVAVGGTF